MVGRKLHREPIELIVASVLAVLLAAKGTSFRMPLGGLFFAAVGFLIVFASTTWIAGYAARIVVGSISAVLCGLVLPDAMGGICILGMAFLTAIVIPRPVDLVDDSFTSRFVPWFGGVLGIPFFTVLAFQLLAVSRLPHILNIKVSSGDSSLTGFEAGYCAAVVIVLNQLYHLLLDALGRRGTDTRQHV